MGYSKMVVASFSGEEANSASCINKIREFLDPFLKEMGLTLNDSNTSTICTISDNIDITVSDNGSTVSIRNKTMASKYEVDSTYGYPAAAVHNMHTCHAVLSKHKNVLSIGMSPSDTSPPYLTETIVKYGDNNFIAIQHGACIKDNVTNYTDDNDVYMNMTGGYKETSHQISLWYRNDDFVAMVPAINPWTNEVIPDLYLATIHPTDTRSLRQRISVGNRTFMSGLITSNVDHIKNAPLNFIEI